MFRFLLSRFSLGIGPLALGAIGAIGGVAGALGKKKPPKWQSPDTYWSPEQMMGAGRSAYDLLQQRYGRAGKGREWLSNLYFQPAKSQLTAAYNTGASGDIESAVGQGGLSSRSPLVGKQLRGRQFQLQTDIGRAAVGSERQAYQDMNAEELQTLAATAPWAFERSRWGMQDAQARFGAKSARAAAGKPWANAIAGGAAGFVGGYGAGPGGAQGG